MASELASFDFDDAIRRYEAGVKVAEITRDARVKMELYRRLRAAGVPPRQNKRAGRGDYTTWCADALRLYDEGLTVIEVARQLDIERSKVRKVLVANSREVGQSESMRRRMAAMSADDRRVLAGAANDAARGSKRTPDDLARRAIGKQGSLAHATPDELAIGAEMAALGAPVIHQQAVGKYNLDIGAAPVAVELFGGGWHAYGRHGARLPQRLVDIADAGWNQLIVWTRSHHPLDTALVAEDALAYLERSRTDPTFRRRYRVIWGDGEFYSAGCVDDDEITVIPVVKRGPHRRRS